MKIKVFILNIFLIGASLQSCNQPIAEEQEELPNISEIEVDYTTARFEQIVRNITKANQASRGIGMIQGLYPDFYNLYFTKILPIKGFGTPFFPDNFQAFFTEKTILELLAKTELAFKDYNQVDSRLKEAFQVFKYYFPKFEAPNIYTFISEFGHQVVLFEDEKKDGVGIGLDMFLGNGYPYGRMAKDNPAFSKYLTRTFNKDHIASKVSNLLLDDMLGPTKGNRLIDHMIHNGKRQYLLNKILPTTPDSILLEYSKEEMEWVIDNELAMWAFFFDQDLFYETDMMKINKYVNPSPNSPGMPDGAPGRTANYIGLQIVSAYMKKNPTTTLKELIEVKDAQKVMDESKYKPKRR